MAGRTGAVGRRAPADPAIPESRPADRGLAAAAFRCGGPASIAEGCGKESRAETLRDLQFAAGSTLRIAPGQRCPTLPE
jgi:hypothetical protein